MRSNARVQKVERASTIGENTSILTGRTIERAKRAVGVSPESPLAITSRGLSRSTESLVVLRFDSTGAYI